jgi:hypothetical protein
MKTLFTLLILMFSAAAYASDFGGFDELMVVMAVCSLLAFESFIVIVLAIMKKFHYERVKRTTNIITMSLYFIGLVSSLSFSSSRGGGEAGLIIGILFISGIIAVAIPNFQGRKHA